MVTTTHAPAEETNATASDAVGPHHAAFGLLAAVQVVLILAVTVLTIALPLVRQELGLRPGQLALVSAGYTLPFSGFLLLGGRLADVLGQRRVLVVGCCIVGGAAVCSAVAPTFETLVAARLLQGFGAALTAPAAMALVRSLYPDARRRARALAMWGGLAPIGATAGILVSGVAATWGSWRWALTLPAIVAAVVVALSRRLLPPGVPVAPSPPDIGGSVLVAAGIASLSFGLLTAGDHGWASPEALAVFALSALAWVGFLLVESRVAVPLVPSRLLASPRRLASLGAVMLVAGGHSGISFFLTLYFQQVRGMSPMAATLRFLPLLLPLPLVALISARLVARVRVTRMATAGLGLAALGLVLVGQLRADTPYLGALLVGLLVFSTGTALTLAGSTVVAVDGIRQAHAGLAGGLVNTAVELGPAVVMAALVALAGTHTAELLHSGHGQAAATTAGYGFSLTVAAAVFAVAAVGLAAAGRNR